MDMINVAVIPDTKSDRSKIEPPLIEAEEMVGTEPPKPSCGSATDQHYVRPEWPDFLGRMRAIYGDKVHEETGAEIVRWDRDRF